MCVQKHQRETIRDRAAVQTLGLSGRVVIVTGGGQGIGRVFAQAFAGVGARVIVAEINESSAARVAAEILEDGGEALAIPTDVGNPNSVDAMAHAVHDSYGRIDVLINNAAIFSSLTVRSFEQIPLDEWERVLQINVTGPFLCTRAVVPFMRKANWGRIVNISSAAVTLGRPNYLHYTTSKAAIIGMTRSMARELGSDGITVNAIMPGATFTEVPRATVSPAQKEALIAAQCIPRPGTPTDIVGSALFLASEMSSFITGQTVTVDGGCTHP